MIITNGINGRIGRKGQVLRLGGGAGASFSVTLTGLTNNEAIIGDHASVSYTTDPVSATETVKWSSSANPADAATYGTGASPTDYTAGDEGRLYLHVTDGGETVTRSALIRYARGTAPAVADGQAWTVDDTTVNIDGSASGANLTFTYAISGLPSGVSINASTGAITGTPTSVDSGTATITATDQYGLAYTDTFTWANTLRTQATAAGGLGPFSFAQNSAISSTDISADFTANGNTLTYSISPALPAGLSLASNGILTGAPTTLQSATSYTLTGQDEYGRETDSTFTIAVVEASAFDPVDLFGVGDTGGVLDISPSTCFTDAGTTPATVGDAVYQVTNRADASSPAIEAVLASRPTLQQEPSGEYYLDFDGVDDGLSISGLNIPNGATVAYAASVGDLSANRAFYRDSGNNAIGFTNNGSSDTHSLFAGTVLGSSVAPVDDVPFTRVDVLNGASSSITLNGTEIVTGNAGTSPLIASGRFLRIMRSNFFPTDGRLYHMTFINRVLTSGESADLSTYITGKRP